MLTDGQKGTTTATSPSEHLGNGAMWQYYDSSTSMWQKIGREYAEFLDLAFADNVQMLDLGEYKYDFRRWTQISNFSGMSRELKRVMKYDPSNDNVEQAVDAYREKRWEKWVESYGKIVFPKTSTTKFSQKSVSNPHLVLTSSSPHPHPHLSLTSMNRVAVPGREAQRGTVRLSRARLG